MEILDTQGLKPEAGQQTLNGKGGGGGISSLASDSFASWQHVQ